MKRFIRPALLALLPVFLVAGVGVTAFAGGFRHGGHDPAKMKAFIDKRVESELDSLKATDAQRQQVAAIVDGFFAEAVKDHEGQHGEMRSAVAGVLESGDSAKMDELIDEHAARKTALAHNAVKAGMQIRAVLTAEQRAQLAQDIRDHKGWQKF